MHVVTPETHEISNVLLEECLGAQLLMLDPGPGKLLSRLLSVITERSVSDWPFFERKLGFLVIFLNNNLDLFLRRQASVTIFTINIACKKCFGKYVF